MTLPPPSHVKLRRYRVTPEHLEDFQAELDRLALSAYSAIEGMADKTAPILERIYSRGFDDGYAAALLGDEEEKRRNGG